MKEKETRNKAYLGECIYIKRHLAENKTCLVNVRGLATGPGNLNKRKLESKKSASGSTE